MRIVDYPRIIGADLPVRRPIGAVGRADHEHGGDDHDVTRDSKPIVG
jgi:hypothetical protein